MNSIFEYVGSIDQIFSARPIQYLDGKAAGLRCIQVKNDILSFSVMQDRCLDLLDLNFKGINLSFLSKTGITNSSFTDISSDSARSFMVGALFTCGFENLHTAKSIDGKDYPQHGRIRSTPAEKVSILTSNDNKVISISGEMRESELFGENIVLRRRIETSFQHYTIDIYDEIQNQGFRNEPLLFLYHCNAGYPFLTPGVEIMIPSKKIEPRDDISRQNIKKINIVDSPVNNEPEQVFLHELNHDPQGNTVVAFINNNSSIALAYRWNVKDIPLMAQWKSRSSGDYVCAFEPTNSGFEGRNKVTQWLKPFETKNNHIQICLYDSRKDIALLKQEICSLH